MLLPLHRYTIKGFLWNQGESNVGQHEEYPKRQRDMVQHWRELWGLGELPFYFVELPAGITALPMPTMRPFSARDSTVRQP